MSVLDCALLRLICIQPPLLSLSYREPKDACEIGQLFFVHNADAAVVHQNRVSKSADLQVEDSFAIPLPSSQNPLTNLLPNEAVLPADSSAC